MTPRSLALLRFWLGVGFFGCAALFYLCLMPSPPQPTNIRHIDKIEHFTAYLLLGAWFAGIVAPHYLRVFFGLLVFGVLIEIAQGLSGYRDAQLGDAVADVLGTLAGIGLAHIGAMRWLEPIDRRIAARRARVAAKKDSAR